MSLLIFKEVFATCVTKAEVESVTFTTILPTLTAPTKEAAESSSLPTDVEVVSLMCCVEVV